MQPLLKLNSADLGDFHPFVLPARWRLGKGSTITVDLSDGRRGSFEVTTVERDSFRLRWSCNSSAHDGKEYELAKTHSVITANLSDPDWNVEIRPARVSRK